MNLSLEIELILRKSIDSILDFLVKIIMKLDAINEKEIEKLKNKKVSLTKQKRKK